MLGVVNYLFFFLPCVENTVRLERYILPGAIIIANSYFNIYRPSVRLSLTYHSLMPPRLHIRR